MSSRLFRSALPVLLGLALSVGVLGTAAAQDKVVYHIDESASQATKALRNIRNHLDVEPKTTLAFIIMAADAISAARPGARRENMESYIKRLETLEALCNGFEGVESSYAVQAGREVRILVQPDKVSDDQVILLARNVAKKIENELDYPGQIKVSVIRESRATEYAK